MVGSRYVSLCCMGKQRLWLGYGAIYPSTFLPFLENALGWFGVKWTGIEWSAVESSEVLIFSRR